MDDSDKDEPDGVARFLREFEETGRVLHSAQVSGTSYMTLLRLRGRDDQFAMAWASALAAHKEPGAAPCPPPAPAPSRLGKKAAFLEALAETSSVTASAQRARMTLREAYALRRRDEAFAAAWRGALVEGYDLLEGELLAYLRDPRPRHRMDVASALRLLAAHRDTVARERALREDEDEEAVLASIDRFIDEMRERRIANAALLLEDQSTGICKKEAGDAAG